MLKNLQRMFRKPAPPKKPNPKSAPSAPPAVVDKQKIIREALVARAANDISPDRVVKNGPFKGMQYPKGRLSPYAPFPRLLGTYETELWPFIEKGRSKQYDAIVDIGSGDGYFAVGLALLHPESQIFAFDTNPKSNEYLLSLAKENNVDGRLTQGEFCDPTKLLSLPLGSSSLIFCDCEGYKKQLFTPEVAKALSTHDIIVETHDLKNFEITPHLRAVFSETHNIEVARTIEDVHKVNDWHYPEMSGYSRTERFMLFAEGRRGGMEWFYITPKA